MLGSDYNLQRCVQKSKCNVAMCICSTQHSDVSHHVPHLCNVLHGMQHSVYKMQCIALVSTPWPVNLSLQAACVQQKQKLEAHHENYIPDGGDSLRMHKLFNNFSCCQIPFDAHSASCTEGASHYAANLRRHTECGTLMTGDMRSARGRSNII